MARLLSDNPAIAMRPRDLYNESQRDGDTSHEGKTRIQHLLDILSGGDYRVEFALNPRNKLTYLYFTLNAVLGILKQNPDVILMDCTYKTNRVEMPLLNIIGTTGMDTTIHLAQAFLRDETVETTRGFCLN